MNYIQCYQLCCFISKKSEKNLSSGRGWCETNFCTKCPIFRQIVNEPNTVYMSLFYSALILSKLATLVIFALIFHTFHNMQIDGNGLQFVRMTFILATVIGVNLRQNSWRFESKQLLFTWKVLRTLGKRHNLPIFWQWSTISVPKKEANVVIETTSDG